MTTIRLERSAVIALICRCPSSTTRPKHHTNTFRYEVVTYEHTIVTEWIQKSPDTRTIRFWIGSTVWWYSFFAMMGSITELYGLRCPFYDSGPATQLGYLVGDIPAWQNMNFSVFYYWFYKAFEIRSRSTSDSCIHVIRCNICENFAVVHQFAISTKHW
jgi:hypothetical protein